MAKINIIDLNRQGGIGANSHYIEIGQWKAVVDVGLHPKFTGYEALPNFKKIPDDTLNVILVTHAHLDHLGALPSLAQRHPDAKILMSSGTAMIAPRMLRNSVQVMKTQRAELGISEYPLYTNYDIKQIEERIIGVDFLRPHHIGVGEDGLEVEFYPSGHIPGAASIRMTHGGRTILVTGDIQFEHQYILDGAYTPKLQPDLLITETTRGDTERIELGTRENIIKHLLGNIKRILDKGGSCLVPVFALGRMQEMLATIHIGLSEGKIPPCQIFCSGLGMEIVNYFDLLSRQFGYLRFDRSIVNDLNIRRPSRDIKPGTPPSERGLYLLSSGMLIENTPSYNLAASIISDPNSGICFVGYCDPDTPGGQLKDLKQGNRFYFSAHNYDAEIRADIQDHHLTGHADRGELVLFAKQQAPKNILLTHGDEEARDWFRKNLHPIVPEANIHNPLPGDILTL
jgi:Cft2 family RNA processing exonuclease